MVFRGIIVTTGVLPLCTFSEVANKFYQLHLLPIILDLRLTDVHADGLWNLDHSKNTCALRIERTNESIFMVNQDFM